LSHIGTFQWPPSKISEVFKSAPYCGDCRLLAAVLTPYKGSRFKHSSFRYGFSEYNQVTLTIEVHFGEHNIHPRPYADVRLEVYTSSGTAKTLYYLV
jgi:hypothetical protein